jgi:hypothetical protein
VLQYTVSPAAELQQRLNASACSDTPLVVDAALMRDLYAAVVADPPSCGLPSTSDTNAALEILCDDALHDHEFIAASDKSGSSVMDVSRIQMMNNALLGGRGGAFGGPAVPRKY